MGRPPLVSWWFLPVFSEPWNRSEKGGKELVPPFYLYGARNSFRVLFSTTRSRRLAREAYIFRHDAGSTLKNRG
jgi:hypothetical protein